MPCRTMLLSLSIFLLLSVSRAGAEPAIDVRKIWDKAPHNAFTDLIRHGNFFYCSFREGTGHVPGENGKDGTVRILRSAKGENWESIALLTEEGVDLRDPKLSITPDGRIMVTMGGSFYDGRTLLKRHPRVAFSDTAGANFSKPRPMQIDPKIDSTHDWIWRTTWHNGTAYAVDYQRGAQRPSYHVVASDDGITWRHVASPAITGSPNETTIRFRPDGTMLLLVRREEADRRGWFGTSRPPYKDYKFTPLDRRVGGPNLLILSDDTLVFGGRDYRAGGAVTIVGTIQDQGATRVAATLPSGRDTSYPGLLVVGDELWVSYYSGHEGRTSIYLARLPLAALKADEKP